MQPFLLTSVISGGNLEVGKIQYACRLFNKYSTETTFSAASELISLTSDVESGNDEFTGDDIEVNSNKSVRLNIELSNTDYEYMHVYSIHYKTKDTPVISLVGELPITNISASFIDSGTILDTITVEEYNAFGGKLFSAETLAVKNNILFAANTEELSDIIDEEDLDCRAYRFPQLGVVGNLARVFEGNGNVYYIANNGIWEKRVSETDSTLISSGTNWTLPIDADCINKYNDEFLVPNESAAHPYEFIYKSDGTTIGGTGKIVSYEIKVDDSFNDSNKLVNDGETIVNSDNITHILKSTSFKQGETYRIGITFYDLKGKPYFNKWVGDIRIPYFG